MKEILIGVISGTVAALGMGGGTVLILLLGIFTNMNQHIIQGTNLIFFVPTSIVAISMNIKNKTIDYKKGLIFIFWGIIGAIIGSKMSFIFDSQRQRKYFGIFLLIIAFFEVYTLFRTYIINKKVENK